MEKGRQWISEKEAAAIAGLSRKWFQRMRWMGGGPPYVKITPGRSGAVRYELGVLLDWLDKRTCAEDSRAN